jgi:hypothetical protein
LRFIADWLPCAFADAIDPAPEAVDPTLKLLGAYALHHAVQWSELMVSLLDRFVVPVAVAKP